MGVFPEIRTRGRWPLGGPCVKNVPTPWVFLWGGRKDVIACGFPCIKNVYTPWVTRSNPRKPRTQHRNPLWLYGLLRRSTVFYGVLRSFAAFCGLLRRSTVFCGVLRSFAAFYGLLRRSTVFCGVLRSFAAFYGLLRRSTAFYGLRGGKGRHDLFSGLPRRPPLL
jgi:hypothetical protein